MNPHHFEQNGLLVYTLVLLNFDKFNIILFQSFIDKSTSLSPRPFSFFRPGLSAVDSAGRSLAPAVDCRKLSTRFAHLPRLAALGLVALFLAAAGWMLSAPGKGAAVAKAGQYTDMRLYRDVVAQMQRGVPYHRASAELQRAHGYPLKPFVTMRPPTLYLLAARLGWPVLQFGAMALVLANVLAWAEILCTFREIPA